MDTLLNCLCVRKGRRFKAPRSLRYKLTGRGKSNSLGLIRIRLMNFQLLQKLRFFPPAYFYAMPLLKQDIVSLITLYSFHVFEIDKMRLVYPEKMMRREQVFESFQSFTYDCFG